MITQIDVAGGVWVAETAWTRLLFREAPPTWETGEDYNWCYALNKYANKPCLILPIDDKDPKTWSFSPDYMELSDRGDTTWTTEQTFKGTDVMGPRSTTSIGLFNRGWPVMFRDKLNEQPNIVLVATTKGGFESLLSFYRDYETHFCGGSCFRMYGKERHVYFAVHHSHVEAAIGKKFHGIDHLSVFSIRIGADYSRQDRHMDVLSDVMFTTHQIINTVQPKVVFSFDGVCEASSIGVIHSLEGVSSPTHLSFVRPPSGFGSYSSQTGIANGAGEKARGPLCRAFESVYPLLSHAEALNMATTALPTTWYILSWSGAFGKALVLIPLGMVFLFIVISPVSRTSAPKWS